MWCCLYEGCVNRSTVCDVWRVCSSLLHWKTRCMESIYTTSLWDMPTCTSWTCLPMIKLNWWLNSFSSAQFMSLTVFLTLLTGTFIRCHYLPHGRTTFSIIWQLSTTWNLVCLPWDEEKFYVASCTFAHHNKKKTEQGLTRHTMTWPPHSSVLSSSDHISPASSSSKYFCQRSVLFVTSWFHIQTITWMKETKWFSEFFHSLSFFPCDFKRSLQNRHLENEAEKVLCVIRQWSHFHSQGGAFMH